MIRDDAQQEVEFVQPPTPPSPPTYSCIAGEDDENIPLEILIRIPSQAYIVERPPSYEGRLPIYTRFDRGRPPRTLRMRVEPIDRQQSNNGRLCSCIICCIILIVLLGVPTLAVLIVSSVDKQHNYSGSF